MNVQLRIVQLRLSSKNGDIHVAVSVFHASGGGSMCLNNSPEVFNGEPAQ
jgi:hypothetical protein